MSDEIPFGYCHCGCGKKTNLSSNTDRKTGHIKGKPLKYLFGHQQRKVIDEPNPSGVCQCGCGQKTELAKTTYYKMKQLAGKPLRFIKGHYAKMKRVKQYSPNPSGICMCGCGKRTSVYVASSTKFGQVVGQLARFLPGHHHELPFEERFWEKVDVRSADECWEWKGAKMGHGVAVYGKIVVGKSAKLAHRIAYELSFNKSPGELCVCHKCDNPLCCNPNHFFLGTRRDNNRDRHIKGRDVNPGNPGMATHFAKLTDSDVVEIRNLSKTTKMTQEELGEMFGVSGGTIHCIVKRKTWRHIP